MNFRTSTNNDELKRSDPTTHNIEKVQPQEYSSPLFWKEATEWIRSKGGFVHQSLSFQLPSREITLTSSVAKNTLLLKIPPSCLVTLQLIEHEEENAENHPRNSNFVSLFNVVHSLDKIYHQKDDLLLALYLSCVKMRSTEYFLRPYLNTLPSYEQFHHLPKRWDDNDLETYLTGTSLLQRVRAEREGLRNDYDSIIKSWKKLTLDTSKDKVKAKEEKTNYYEIPTFEMFDHMMSNVASRAFAGLGESAHNKKSNKNKMIDGAGLDAMIPVLDLFNHKRGVNANSDIRYVRSLSAGTDTSTDSKESDAIYVTACKDLDVGSVPGITYGAKGNSQLLLRYGFCLESNIEPDGSSNNVLEFQANPDHPVVELKTGPKSYTFGGFIKVLELFYPTNTRQVPSQEAIVDNKDEGIDEGMEAFLNSCDNVEEDEMDDFDIYDDDHNNGNGTALEAVGDDFVVASDGNNLELQYDALESLYQALKQAMEKYKVDKKRDHTEIDKQNLQKHYSKLLVQSELDTLSFYMNATQKLMDRIIRSGKIKKKDKIHSVQRMGENLSAQMESQVDDLVKAFLQIRHPELLEP